jgi:hypothetical protein
MKLNELQPAPGSRKEAVELVPVLVKPLDADIKVKTHALVVEFDQDLKVVKTQSTVVCQNVDSLAQIAKNTRS